MCLLYHSVIMHEKCMASHLNICNISCIQVSGATAAGSFSVKSTTFLKYFYFFYRKTNINWFTNPLFCIWKFHQRFRALSHIFSSQKPKVGPFAIADTFFFKRGMCEEQIMLKLVIYLVSLYQNTHKNILVLSAKNIIFPKFACLKLNTY